MNTYKKNLENLVKIADKIKATDYEFNGNNITVLGENTVAVLKTEDTGLNTLGVGASEFKTLVKCLSKDQFVEIKQEDKEICFIQGKDIARLQVREEEIEYKLPTVDGVKLGFETKRLAEDYRTIKAGMSKDSSRLPLTGVNLKIKDGELKLATLDGYRLMLKKYKLSKETEDLDIILHSELLESINAIRTISETVVLQVGKEYTVAQLGDIEIYSKNINGFFFRYEEILKEPEYYIDLDYDTTKEIREKLKNYTGKDNLCKISIKENTMYIESNLNEVVVKDEIKIDNENKVDTDKLMKGGAIAFNGKYLLDQFKTIDSGRLGLIDEVNPIRLENETTDGILLPVRLR